MYNALLSRSARAGGLALLALLLATLPFVSWAGQGEGMRQRKPRELVRSTHSTYRVLDAGTEIGTEAVTQEVYSDNTVRFRCAATTRPAEGLEMVTETDLLLEEESYFPIRFGMKKVIRRAGREKNMEHVIDVEMFANVAVVRSNLGTREDTTRLVLPSGTAFVSLEFVHLYYQVLFWYDEALGGRQNIGVFDPVGRKVTQGTVRHQSDETAVIGGKEERAAVYVLEMGPASVTLFVGADGRILKATQEELTYELAEGSGGSDTRPE